MSTKNYSVEGMTCEHCVASVQEEVAEVAGTQGVEVELESGRLVVTGAQTDACIRSTLHGGFTRGYDVTLVTDAHTTEDLSEWGAPPPEQVVAHTNLYWSFQRAPGRIAQAVPSDEVDLVGAAG